MSSDSIGFGDLPYMTADLPGVGGVIKRYDEDFLVEEIPLYSPSGQGTHIYFLMEKRGLTTPAAIRELAGALRRNPRDFGYAGLKDAHGVTRQMVSIEHVEPERVASLSFSRIRILSVDRHTNKIKLGHLSGNRFDLRIRDTIQAPLEVGKAIVDRLASRGAANYFGPQRFGTRGDNAAVGRAVICEDYGRAIDIMLGKPTDIDRGAARKARELFEAGDVLGAAQAWSGKFPQQARLCCAFEKFDGDAARTWRSVDRSLRMFYLSAVQSDLFNRVVARRANSLDTLMVGDVAWKHRNGACFGVEDAVTEQPRCDSFEISPSGPLFGRKMKAAGGVPGEIETAILDASGLTMEALLRWSGKGLTGARRPLRVPLSDPVIGFAEDQHGSFLRLSFQLPPGSYATVVTRELCKA